MNREEAIEVIVPHLGEHDAVVGTTGFLSRELYEYRRKKL
jgi:phosphonopyruvate decarboxylase